MSFDTTIIQEHISHGKLYVFPLSIQIVKYPSTFKKLKKKKKIEPENDFEEL